MNFKAKVYFYKCQNCGAINMTNKKMPLPTPCSCMTCGQVKMIYGMGEKTLKIADDGRSWLEMLEEAEE